MVAPLCMRENSVLLVDVQISCGLDLAEMPPTTTTLAWKKRLEMMKELDRRPHTVAGLYYKMRATRRVGCLCCSSIFVCMSDCCIAACEASRHCLSQAQAGSARSENTTVSEEPWPRTGVSFWSCGPRTSCLVFSGRCFPELVAALSRDTG